MASSSVSQEDFENDFELNSRRSRIRSARARTSNSTRLDAPQDNEDTFDLRQPAENTSGATGTGEHDASPKPFGRGKEKRGSRSVPIRQPLADHINRANHLTKGKQQRDRRKLREKRRSTGVVHLQSTESTGGSTGEEEEQLSSSVENKGNNFQFDHLPEDRATAAPGKYQRRNKSPSDLDADDEDNQNQSDSTVSSFAQIRPGTPIAESEPVEERLERAQAENRRLLLLLEEKDKKIVGLESRVNQIMTETVSERTRLHEQIDNLVYTVNTLKSE